VGMALLVGVVDATPVDAAGAAGARCRPLDCCPHPATPTVCPRSGPMVINGASLPESLLEALGMPSGAGFQIKLVRSGAASTRMACSLLAHPACTMSPHQHHYGWALGAACRSRGARNCHR
jgi:hypothetical protein